jgi:hypothetical protein
MHSTNYANNGSVTRYLNATVEGWEIQPCGEGSRLVGGLAIRNALIADRITSTYAIEGGDLLFHDTPSQLKAKMEAADYGAYVKGAGE